MTAADYIASWPGVQKAMADSKTTNEPSAYDEAMAFTRDQHGPLSERENAIAATAARIAYRWALREIISDLENKVRMT